MNLFLILRGVVLIIGIYSMIYIDSRWLIPVVVAVIFVYAYVVLGERLFRRN